MQTTCSSAASSERAGRAPRLGGPWLAAALAFALLVLAPLSADAGRVRYTVAPGDTLGGIAEEYDVSMRDIRRWNGLDGDAIFVGQELILHTRSGSGERVQSTYTVRSGDTGGAIARRHNVSARDLARWNPRINLDRLRPGQRLTIYIEDLGGAGSRGSPNRGRLRGGVQLESGTGYRVRTPSRAFGTLPTVNAIRTGVSRVVGRYMDAPDIVVHDLSFERGGSMAPHLSHQNGLDADISYYRVGATDECPYDPVAPDELDVELQWYLFRAWIDQGAVEYIFMDHELQAPLYAYAQARGATDAQLAEWFQYPGRGRTGIIRDEPGHDDHFHVRFRQ